MAATCRVALASFRGTPSGVSVSSRHPSRWHRGASTTRSSGVATHTYKRTKHSSLCSTHTRCSPTPPPHSSSHCTECTKPPGCCPYTSLPAPSPPAHTRRRPSPGRSFSFHLCWHCRVSLFCCLSFSPLCRYIFCFPTLPPCRTRSWQGGAKGQTSAPPRYFSLLSQVRYSLPITLPSFTPPLNSVLFTSSTARRCSLSPEGPALFLLPHSSASSTLACTALAISSFFSTPLHTHAPAAALQHQEPRNYLFCSHTGCSPNPPFTHTVTTQSPPLPIESCHPFFTAASSRHVRGEYLLAFGRPAAATHVGYHHHHPRRPSRLVARRSLFSFLPSDEATACASPSPDTLPAPTPTSFSPFPFFVPDMPTALAAVLLPTALSTVRTISFVCTSMRCVLPFYSGRWKVSASPPPPGKG